MGCFFVLCVCFFGRFSVLEAPRRDVCVEDSPSSEGEDETAEGPSVECAAQVGYTTHANNNIFD